MRRFALAALACLMLTSPALAERERTAVGSNPPVRMVQKVAPGQLLEINLESGASLRIVGWDRNEVSVETSDAEADCPDAVISLDHATHGARLESFYPPETGDNHECSLALDVRVPRRFDIRLRSAGGDVTITGLRGSYEGHTGGGSLALTGLKGQARLRTGGGEILVRDSDLDGRLNTGGGGVHFDNVRGGITATSGSVRGVTRARPRSS
jgi:hypothetical protein